MDKTLKRLLDVNLSHGHLNVFDNGFIHKFKVGKFSTLAFREYFPLNAIPAFIHSTIFNSTIQHMDNKHLKHTFFIHTVPVLLSVICLQWGSFTKFLSTDVAVVP